MIAVHAIETTGLTRTFGSKKAVDGLTMTVKAGTFFGFLGPNGAGKSTTINMLTGMIGISSGTARLLGHDIATQPLAAKRLIGVLPEDTALFDRLTGREYLSFIGRMYGMAPRAIQSRSDQLMKLMELAEEQGKLIVDYSHGMKKKLALSAALIHKPKVLFLDEPFEGIDALAARTIKHLLNDLVARGVTIFLTSHILEIVERLCTDVAIINKGKLVAQGTIDELRLGISLPGYDRTENAMTLEEIFLSIVANDEPRAHTLSWLA